MRASCFAALLLAAAFGARAESTQCTAVTAVPVVLTTEGNYCLTADLSSTVTGSAAAITIGANNVTLDLNGHTLVGPGGATAGYGVYAIARRAARIRNGTIRGFSRGVVLTDTLVGLPPVLPSGASTRHEVSGLRVEGAITGIQILGHFSSIHDNEVLDSTQYGIVAGSSYAADNTGAIDIKNNRVLNTIGVAGATSPVYGINAAGTGSVVEGNYVSRVRGPTGSAGIALGGVGVVASRNRETDLNGLVGVNCTNTNPQNKVEGNIVGGVTGTTGTQACYLVGVNN